MKPEPLALLSHDEETRLVREYQRTHDSKLGDRLVRSQLRWVMKLARDYARGEDDIAELIQEGSLGLVHAIRRFDPDRGVRLGTYASWWIRAYQLRWLVQNHRLVRLGTTAAQRRLFFHLRGARARLSSAGLEPGIDELAKETGVDVETVEQTLRRLDHREVSLDERARADGTATRIERLADPSQGPEERAEAAERAEIVAREAHKFRDGLQGRERVLFEARWLAEAPPTLQDLGTRFGVSRERARQLEDRLLHRLRARLPADLANAA